MALSPQFFTAEDLTEEQWLNYIYWLQEDKKLRGIQDIIAQGDTPNTKIHNIRVSVSEFMSKYPTGILTGWSSDMSATRAKYAHDCDQCTFLAHFDTMDLYVCGKNHPTVIARFGDLPEDYKSGIRFASVDDHLWKASSIAKERGLL